MFKKRNFDPRLVTILLIVFVQMVGASMALPILPLFAKREFAMQPGTITLLISVFFAAQFVSGPFIGRASDRYGRLPVLIISQVGTVISFVMLALAQGPAMLFASRILDGITGGNIIVAQAYVTDITPRSRRTQSLGLIFAAFGVGFTIGPALGGVLAALFGERVPFLFASVAAAVTVWLTWRNLDETLTPEKRAASLKANRPGLSLALVLGNSPLVLILLLTFATQFSLGLLQATFALYGESVLFRDYSEAVTNLGIGLLLATVGLGQVFTQLVLLQRMLNRFGEGWLVVIGTGLRTLSLFALAVALGPLLGALGTFLFAVGSGLMMPALQSLSTNTVGDNLRGGVLGLHQSAVSLSVIFSTALGGTLFAIEPTFPYWLATGMMLVLLIPAMHIMRWSSQQQIEQPAAQD